MHIFFSREPSTKVVDDDDDDDDDDDGGGLFHEILSHLSTRMIFFKPGTNVINIAMKCWNKALWLAAPCHMTILTNQSALFQQSIATYATLKFVHDNGSCNQSESLVPNLIFL